MSTLNASNYYIQCLGSSQVLFDEEQVTQLPLDNVYSPVPALLRTVYKQKQFILDSDAQGIYKMACWLPIQRKIPTNSLPQSYQSEALAKHLGLKDLIISFSGYWPERDCKMLSTSFKECEAQAVCSRFPETFFTNNLQYLVLASAGNTARAFATVCAKVRIPVIIVIAEQNLSELWSVEDISPWTRILAIADGDYYDAIAVAELLASLKHCIPEGGTRNVARRDGMALTTLTAVLQRGRIPDHYFQAVASGGGAIAAWETNERLLRDGRWGSNIMRLHVSQNTPFLPITNSWKAGTRQLISISEEEGREQASNLYAKVLSNRKPAYSIRGGLYDALSATNGETYAVSNKEAKSASALFERLEGIDIDPAAGVTLSSLMQAIEQQTISKDDCILLNITGGGTKRLQKDMPCKPVTPTKVLARKELEKLTAREIFSLITN